MTKRPLCIQVRLEGPAGRCLLSVDTDAAVSEEVEASLRHLFEECLRVTAEVLGALNGGEAGKQGWHESMGHTVLEAWDRLTEPLDGGFHAICFTLVEGRERHEAMLTSRFRANLRSAIAMRTRMNEATIEGVLSECDWKEHTALLDEFDGNRVMLEFPPNLDEQVTALRRQRVRVRGRVESAMGRVVRVRVTSLIALAQVIGVDPRFGGFWDNLSADELARRQCVNPVESLDALKGAWPEEDSVDDFLEFVREVRGR